MEGPTSLSLIIAANAWLFIAWVIASTRRGRGGGGGDGETTTITKGKSSGGSKGGLTAPGTGMGIIEVYVASGAFIVLYSVVQGLTFLQPLMQVVPAFWLSVIIYICIAIFFKQVLRFLSFDLEEALLGIVSMILGLLAAAVSPQVNGALMWFANAIGLTGGTI